MRFASILLPCLSTELRNRNVGSIQKGKTDGQAETEVVVTACIKKVDFFTNNN